MQRKLFRLGYFEGSKYKTEDEAADGEWGSNTRNALMQFLRNNKLDRNIDNGLSTSAFVDLMRCEETRTEAKARIKAENRILLKENVSGISDGDLEKILDMDDPELWDCVDALLSNNIPGATPEQEKRFNGAVILCLASNNVYSKGDRLVGYNTVVDHFNNGGNTPFDFDKKLGFDCSSFASTIAMIAYNFDKPQDTSTFNKDNRYTRKSYSEISIESLEKGDMILGLGDNHIVVYVGNGIVVHSHKSHGSEISANSLYGDSNYNTQIFLKTGYFNELVVLKPNIGTNG